MLHLYSICLVLSSLFAYNASAAENRPLRYAFFIPADSLQKNTTIQDIRLMHPRHIKTEESSSATESYNKISSPEKKAPSDKTSAANRLGQKTTLPVEKSRPATIKKQTLESLRRQKSMPDTAVKPEKPQPLPAPDTKEIVEKLKNYKLDDSPVPPVTARNNPAKPAEPVFSELEKLQQKDLSELLAAIPYPDSRQPKFRQLYDNYGLEMRMMQRRGDFPDNPEQEKTLAKANSLRRFKVQ